MHKILIYLVCFFSVFIGFHSYSQVNEPRSHASSKLPGFVSGKDVFGGRVFVENKGQFPDIAGLKVHYALDNGYEKIYFTQKGLVYELTKVSELGEEVLEKMERGKENALKPNKLYFVQMNWLDANTNISISPEEKQHHYITYGERELNSRTYKKIIYRNVYDGIDIEYTFPLDKEQGIKYSVIIHPGANPSKVKIKYSGDVGKIKALENGGIIIKTPVEDIVEHAPLSFFQDQTPVSSAFVLTDEIISFSFEGLNLNSKTLIIDPWVSSTGTLTGNGYAYDVDYDYLGNTFVFGGTGTFKVAQYDNSGILQWVFSGNVISQSWVASQYVGNFGVDKFTSKTYVGQGFDTNGNRIIRLDASGNYDNFISVQNILFREVWDMGFHCTTASVFVLGGGTNSNISAVTMNTVSGAVVLSTFQPTVNTIAHDVVSHAIDDAGNIFVISAGATAVHNKLCLVNSTFNGNIWTQPSGFLTLGEAANKSNYVGGSASSNGFNALAVNANYLYYYDGLNLGAYNKLTGANVAVTTVSGQSVKQQGGIAVDDCNNLYLGGNGSIRTFSFNGTSFIPQASISLSATSTNQYVYDIKLDKNSKILYVCGSGFAGKYVPVSTMGCATASSACLFSQGGISVTSSSITCASLGSATCTAAGGIGPFTYTWLPSMQTGSVATGLNPGTHFIVVNDIGNNNTYTASTYLSPLVAFTGSVTNPLVLDCYGVNNGTATINNLSGGSGSQTFLWANNNGTQTTSVASGLGIGVYSVTVTDALTSCMIKQTFTVTQPPALSLTINASGNSVCATTSIILTPLVSGGTPAYSYTWAGGPNAGIYVTTQPVGGNYIYSVNVQDSKSCSTSGTIGLNFLNTHTLSLSNVSICPLTVGTLTVSGASSYTWNNSSTGNTFTASPLSTSVYSVTGSGSLCPATSTVSIIVNPLPTPTISSNSPICATQSLQLFAGGGSSYQWTGPPPFSSILQNPAVNPASVPNSGVYNVKVTAANSCTASVSTTVLVRPSPALSAIGSTVCNTQTMTLTGSSTPGAGFLWKGPNSFSTSTQNPVVINPAVGLSGSYTLFVTDAFSCTNSAIADITITAMPVVSFTTNSPRCENDVLNLNASATSGAILYNWTGPGGFLSFSQSPFIPNVGLSAGGTYSLTVSAGPCVTGTSQTVIIHPIPTLTISGTSSVCETKSLGLTVSTSPGVISYHWFGPAALNSSSQSIIRYSCSPSYSGIYTVTVGDGYLCSNSGTINIKILPNPVLSVSNVTVCLNEPALLTASGANSYFWRGPGNFQSGLANAVVPSANNTFPTQYTVTGTAVNSCTSIALVTLNTIPLPTASLTVEPSATLCLNDQVTLTGFGGITYQWRGPNALYYEGQTVNMLLSGNFFAGQYTLTVLDKEGCKASKVTTLLIHELPNGSLIRQNMQSCVPFCSDFSFSSVSSSVSTNWLINKQFISGQNFAYCFNEPGTYTLTGLLYDESTTCKNSIDFFVRAYPKPHADYTYAPLKPVENVDEVIFTNTSQGEELNRFNWYFPPINGTGNGKTSTSLNTSYLFNTEGNYPVALIAKNKWNCSDSVVKTIQIDPDFVIYVPNAFTPNEDNRNEVFLPVTRAIRIYHLSIYNRWGALIFETTDPLIGWDGTYKGESCKSDVYAWKIKLSALNGENKELQGHVTLYR